MRDMPALSSNQQQQENNKSKTKKDNKNENKDACQSSANNNQTATLERRNNSIKRKDVQLTKQASTTSSLHQLHNIDQQHTLNGGQLVQHSIDSPPPQPPASSLSKQSTLQTLNVSTLPLNTGSLMQPSSFLMHNHFHTLANQHHFHHHHSPILMQTATPNSHFHHASCTLTPQTEQLHQLNSFGSLNATNPPNIPSLHHSFGSDAHFNNNLMNSSAAFDPINHLLNSNAQADLSSHNLNLNEETDDYQNENLNHLNLHNHHHHHHHLNDHHTEFSNLASLRNVNSNEINSDCTMQRPMQTICTNDLNDLVQNHANQSNLQQPLATNTAASTNNLNQRQVSCESNTSSSFFLSPAAYKATEAIEYIAEHLRNEDEYVQVNSFFFCLEKIFLQRRKL